jgi:hypothetical protein
MDSTSFKSGLLKQPIDKRDWKLEKLIPMGAIRLPEEYEPDRTDVPVYDQGDSSECCACAYSTIRFIQEQKSGLTEPFAPSFTYGNRLPDEYFEGMYLRSCLKQGKYGSVLWREMPFFGSVSKCVSYFNRHKIDLLNKAKNYKIDSYYVARTDEEIKTGIYLTGACLCGVECQQSIFKPDERNIVKYIPHGKTYGGHALTIIGYKLIDGKEHWIIRNSWGKDYGDNGNFYISFEDFRKIVMDDVYVIVDSDTKYMFEEYKRKFYSNTESSKESAIEVIKRWLENLLLRK